uniref:hypothetical protein n=1 Tax=uncultured Sphingomonas sp. TaxID=158754 RepID=UPI002589A72A|nr:hypothetical protein [uncultured Sphingomonas sp.]
MRGAGNYPVRVANGLAGLSDAAARLYLTLLDRWQGWNNAANETRAFLAACDYDDDVGAVLDHILRRAPLGFVMTDKVRRELLGFFAERYRHNFMVGA